MAKNAVSKLHPRSDTLSRLKGIETQWELRPPCHRRVRSDTLSRLKGIETEGR